MKDELVDKMKQWECFEDVKRDVDDWIDYYNNDRYQWSLAKLSPNQYYDYIITGKYPLHPPYGPSAGSGRQSPAQADPKNKQQGRCQLLRAV